MNACPCCGSEQSYPLNEPRPHHLCLRCHHRWSALHSAPDYSRLRGRNEVPPEQLEHKYNDRLSDLKKLLKDGLRILEVGCAEGDFGGRIKERAAVEYVGIELSADADSAMDKLDNVVRHPAALLHDGDFDLILAFHVLEHISDVSAEVRHWHRLLSASGSLMVEVPNETGHPLLAFDSNSEHLHQFTAASLTTLLCQAGFSCRDISAGHFESPVYPDSLRILAVPCLSEHERREKLISRFLSVMTGPFVIYGIGGDFNNYVAPLLTELPVVALIDSDPDRIGKTVAGHTIEPYDAMKHAGLQALIATLRFQTEVKDFLLQQGMPEQAIIGLEAIYG